MIWDMIIGNDKYFNIGNEIFNFEYIMIEGREVNSEYLLETKTIDYGNPMIQEKVSELRSDTKTMIEYIQKAYEFVRDNILHSWDIQSPIVSRKASEVLENKTGICWTKSCLLAALLRANGIPAGISYQLLTRADDDDSEGYIIHALNTVYIEEQSKWIRLDAQGNKTNVHAEFSIEEEQLAFPVRSQYGEVDYRDNNPDLDERLVSILNNSENILEITTDFTMD
jgi:transglutaminase-like putative cysteine protease